MAEGFTPISVAEFDAMFELLFEAHDLNKNGALQIDEARALLQVVNSKRPDGHVFDEALFSEIFNKHAVDGKLAKETTHHLALKRGQTLGFIEQ